MNHFFWFQHQYEIVACQRLTRHALSDLGEEMEIPVTNIITRCECGKFKEKVVSGHFTLKELKEGCVAVVREAKYGAG